MLEELTENQAIKVRPEWVHAACESTNAESIHAHFFAHETSRTACLRHKKFPNAIATWSADAKLRFCILSGDGTGVVSQENGQVCTLKLHHGNHRVSLAEAEIVLNSQMQKMNAP